MVPNGAKPLDLHFIKKDSNTIFKKTCFEEHLRMAASKIYSKYFKAYKEFAGCD